MGGIFSALHSASAALSAFSDALGVEQENIANASTPGYAAQRVSMNAIDPFGGGKTNGDYITVTSSGNALTDAVVRSATSQASQSQTTAAQLSPINQLFDITGSTGILAALQQFGTAFSQLSVTPNDAALGNAALNAAGNVVSAFHTAAANLNAQGAQVDNAIQNTVAQINSLASGISQLNVAALRSPEPDPGIEANIRSDLDQLSSLVDITTTTAPDGSVTVWAGGQLPLVSDNQAYTLSANMAAPAGAQISSSGGGSPPSSFSGQLGALLQTRNGTMAQLLGTAGNPGTLDTLAAGFAARVNTLLTNGVTAAGAPGVPIFTNFVAANPAGAAANLTLDPTVTAAQLGLATTGAGAESNGVANALAALPGSTAAADQIGGVSPEQFFGTIAASVGQQLSDAQTASTADQTRLTAAQATRQQQSGVSLDQEAVNITSDQRAYQANAQVVAILNQLTQDTMNMVVPTGG